jgi:hypothetical protein
MANKLTDMSKVRKVIQMHHQGKSKLFISKYLSLSRNTDKKYLRAYKPCDKSLVEGAVKRLYQRIYSGLRGKNFHSLEELNKAIWKELKKHNDKKLSGRPNSRAELFIEDEKDKLMPLPQERYEIKQFSFATVMQNGHVMLAKDKHYYSVPYQYIRKKVKLVFTSNKVEIFYKYNRIAVHTRQLKPYSYTTVVEHLASAHQFVTEWTPQRFINRAASIDEYVKEFIIGLLEVKQPPEQAYKSCMGVLSFVKKVGKERLSNACKRAIDHNICNYKIIQKILENGLDQLKIEPEQDQELPFHNNIRGEKFYR